jgi:hypothetical protein
VVSYLDVSGSYEHTGSIPTQIGVLSGLTALYLNGNSFVGTLPSQLGLLTSLTTLALSSNFFTGTVPTEIFRLSQLTWLSVSHNSLSGSVPTLIGNLRNVNTFYVAYNSLGGTIPREISLLTNITELWFTSNKFSGTIPSEIGLWSRLTGFYAELNDLSGTIPTEISRLTALSSIFLTGNQFVGPLPSLQSVTKPENASSFHCFAQYPNASETNCFSVCDNPSCVCGTKRCPYDPPITTPVPPTGVLQRFPTPSPFPVIGPFGSPPAPTSRAANSSVAGESDAAEDVPIIPIVLGVGGAAICLAIVVVVWCIVRRERRSKALRGGGGEISVSNSLATMPAGQQSTMHSAVHDPNLSTQFSHTPSSLPTTSSDLFAFGSGGSSAGGGIPFNGGGSGGAFGGSDRSVTTYQNSAMFLPSPMKVAVAPTSYRPIQMADQRSFGSAPSHQQYAELSLNRTPIVSPYYQINDDL